MDISSWVTVTGSIMTFVGTVAVAKMKINSDRQQYYEDKISEILDVQSKEIKSLKAEIENLVHENRFLRLELERVNRHYEKETANPVYKITK